MKMKPKVGNVITATSMVVAVIALTISAVLFVLSANQHHTNASLTVSYVATNVYVEVDAKYQKKLDASPTALTGGPLTFQPTGVSSTGTLSAGDIVLSPNDNYVLFTYSFKNKATVGGYDIAVTLTDSVNKVNTKVYYAYNDTSTAMSTMATTMTTSQTTTAPQNITIPAQQTKYLYVYVEIDDWYFGASYTSDASHFLKFDMASTTAVNFPAEYQIVEYIESRGGCEIDTGVLPTETIVSQVKFMTNSRNAFSYGTRESIDKSAKYFEGINYRFFQYENRWYVDMGNGTPNGVNNRIIEHSLTVQRYTIYELELGDRYLKDLSSNTILASGDTIELNYSEPFTIKIFSIKGSSASYKQSTIGERLYYCKIYDRDILIRNFIPCYRKSDNEVGLYDTINGVFYTNQGTGTFSIPHSIVPEEYTLVDYIESSGTQYIDTGVTPSYDLTYSLDFTPEYEAKQSSSGDCNKFFGATSNSSDGEHYYSFVINFGGTVGQREIYCWREYRNIGVDHNIIWYKSSTGMSSRVNNITLSDDRYFYVNGNRVTNVGNTIQLDATSQDTFQDTILVFGRNFRGEKQPFDYFNLKVYRLSMWKGDELIRDYVPCYRKSDNKPGLYDKVNGVFYTNGGTGEFLLPS